MNNETAYLLQDETSQNESPVFLIPRPALSSTTFFVSTVPTLLRRQET